jgi:nucleoside-diphosphate-sugar epimerase
MRIVILGANGQVGRVAFAQCCRLYPAAEVIGCVRPFHLHFEGCTGDKHQHSLVFDPFRDNWNNLGKADVLINSIGIIRGSGDTTFESAHIGLTRLILQHRKMLGNPRVIQVSVLGADAKSPSRFLSTKAIADDELLKEEDTFVVRPSIVCTHNTVMVQKLKMLGRIARWTFNRLLFPEQFLKTKIQPVMGDDVGEVIARLAVRNEKNRVINITGPSEINLERLLHMLSNGHLKIVPVPERILRMLMPLAELIAGKEQLMLLSKDNTASNDTAQSILGRPVKSTTEFWTKELNSKPDPALVLSNAW